MLKDHNNSINKANKHLAFQLVLVIVIFVALTNFAGASQPVTEPAEDCMTEDTTEVQILAVNDFHGQLEPPASKTTVGYTETGIPIRVEAGGAEYLATHIKKLSSENPNTLIVSGGDCIGASPLTSALFHDEPTIKALNMMGFDFSAVGNHEFDEGLDELMRIQNGGCHPTTGCPNNTTFEGADFQYLAANVVNETTNTMIFPAYNITCV